MGGIVDRRTRTDNSNLHVPTSGFFHVTALSRLLRLFQLVRASQGVFLWVRHLLRGARRPLMIDVVLHKGRVRLLVTLNG